MTPDLNDAIQAFRKKDFSLARNLLREILRSDPDNEVAWLWMSQVVNTDRERQVCLNQVIRINPQNPHALRGLEILNSRKAGVSQSTLSPTQVLQSISTEIPSEHEVEEPRDEFDSESDQGIQPVIVPAEPKKRSTLLVATVIGLGCILSVALSVVLIPRVLQLFADEPPPPQESEVVVRNDFIPAEYIFVSSKVEPGEETRLELEDGAAIVVPANSLQEEVNITVERNPEKINALPPFGDDFVPLGNFYNFQVDGELIGPVDLIFPFEANKIPNGKGVLTVAYPNGDGWKYVPVIPDGNKVTLYTINVGDPLIGWHFLQALCNPQIALEVVPVGDDYKILGQVLPKREGFSGSEYKSVDNIKVTLDLNLKGWHDESLGHSFTVYTDEQGNFQKDLSAEEVIEGWNWVFAKAACKTGLGNFDYDSEGYAEFKVEQPIVIEETEAPEEVETADEETVEETADEPIPEGAVMIPDFVGQPIDNAIDWLVENGFKYTWIDGSSTFDLGMVYDQAPSSGQYKVPHRTIVILYRTVQKVSYSENDPTASFTYIAMDLSVDFTDASADSDGSVVSWDWDFGDLSSSTSQNSSHTYASARSYTVTLTVTDNDGGTDSVSKSVMVTATNIDPTASFTYIATDLSVDFTDMSIDSDGSVVSWDWDFGDLSSSTSQNPSHAYASAGSYPVTLTVTDDDGSTDRVSKSVTVTATNNELIIEEFEDKSLFTQTSENVSIIDGQVRWNISRSGGPQFIYRQIPEFSGDVRLTVRGQVNSWTNNCTIRAGIGNGFNDSGDQTGVSLNFGFFGGGCSTSGPIITTSGVSLDNSESYCNFSGNWLWIDSEKLYTGELTIAGEQASFVVPDVGTSSGTPIYKGVYNTLFVGFNGTGDWPRCDGIIESVIVEKITN